MIKTKSIKKPVRVLLSILLVLALLPVSSAAAIEEESAEAARYYVEYLPGSHGGGGYYIEYVEAGTLYTVQDNEDLGISNDRANFLWWYDTSNYLTTYGPGQQIVVDRNLTLEAYWIR